MPAPIPLLPINTPGDPEDVLRSLRRYVSLLLGSPPWTVRIQRTRVSDDERPVAIIEESGPLTTPHSRAGTINQGDVQKQQTYTIVCYPALSATAGESREVAGTLRSLLDAGFSRGLVDDSTAPPTNIGAPWRFPLYDFAGVPVTGIGRRGPSMPYGYANVDDFNVRPVQDAMDELRFTVLATARVSWWQGGRVPPTGPTVRQGGVTGTFEVLAP